LEGSSPHVKVRRGVVRGLLGPPKSPTPVGRFRWTPPLALALRERRRGFWRALFDKKYDSQGSGLL
jgi:hypothetical protein